MSRPIRLGLLPLRVTIQRKSRTADGQGGHIEAFANLATSVPARIRPAGYKERATAQREEAVPTHVVYVLPTQDVRRSDLVLNGSLRYEVLDVEDPSEAGHHRHVNARRFESGV
jgi:SPP1 family predicted phage head-tail adaptor